MKELLTQLVRSNSCYAQHDVPTLGYGNAFQQLICIKLASQFAGRSGKALMALFGAFRKLDLALKGKLISRRLVASSRHSLGVGSHTSDNDPKERTLETLPSDTTLQKRTTRMESLFDVENKTSILLIHSYQNLSGVCASHDLI